MYVIERGAAAAWLCVTAIEAVGVEAVQIRLRDEVRDFAVFEQRLDNWERIEASVISVYKCSTANKCVDCKDYIGCKILQQVQETAQAHAEFAVWVEANGGYTF